MTRHTPLPSLVLGLVPCHSPASPPPGSQPQPLRSSLAPSTRLTCLDCLSANEELGLGDFRMETLPSSSSLLAGSIRPEGEQVPWDTVCPSWEMSWVQSPACGRTGCPPTVLSPHSSSSSETGVPPAALRLMNISFFHQAQPPAMPPLATQAPGDLPPGCGVRGPEHRLAPPAPAAGCSAPLHPACSPLLCL